MGSKINRLGLDEENGWSDLVAVSLLWLVKLGLWVWLTVGEWGGGTLHRWQLTVGRENRLKVWQQQHGGLIEIMAKTWWIRWQTECFCVSEPIFSNLSWLCTLRLVSSNYRNTAFFQDKSLLWWSTVIDSHLMMTSPSRRSCRTPKLYWLRGSFIGLSVLWEQYISKIMLLLQLGYITQTKLVHYTQWMGFIFFFLQYIIVLFSLFSDTSFSNLKINSLRTAPVICWLYLNGWLLATGSADGAPNIEIKVQCALMKAIFNTR